MKFRSYNLQCGRLDILTIWLCLILNFPLNLWDKFKPIKFNNRKKILVLKPDHLGDVLVSFPALRRLREKFTDAHIGILIGSWSIELMRINRDVNEMIVFDMPYYIRRKVRRNIYYATLFALNLIKLSISLRKKKFDVIIDLNNTWATKLISYLTGVPQRIGSDIYGNGFMMTDELHVDISRYQIEQNLLLLTPLGAEIENPIIAISIPDKAEEAVNNFLLENNIKNTEPVIGIHPTTGYPSKLWLNKRFASVIDYLLSNFGARIILTGSKGDKDAIQEIINMALHKEAVINTCGKISIPELFALIKKMNMLITVDSFPMHIAAAVGTPVIAIFSAVNDPKRWGPYGQGHIVLFKSLPCSPCLQGLCLKGDNVCMDMISAEEVKEAATKKLLELGWERIGERKI